MCVCVGWLVLLFLWELKIPKSPHKDSKVVKQGKFTPVGIFTTSPISNLWIRFRVRVTIRLRVTISFRVRG